MNRFTKTCLLGAAALSLATSAYAQEKLKMATIAPGSSAYW